MDNITKATNKFKKALAFYIKAHELDTSCLFSGAVFEIDRMYYARMAELKGLSVDAGSRTV